MSQKINDIYPHISEVSYPAVRESLELYSEYIYNCFLFSSYRGDLFTKQNIITNWQSQENQYLTNFNTYIQNIMNFVPKHNQVQIAPGITTPITEPNIKYIPVPVPVTTLTPNKSTNLPISFQTPATSPEIALQTNFVSSAVPATQNSVSPANSVQTNFVSPANPVQTNSVYSNPVQTNFVSAAIPSTPNSVSTNKKKNKKNNILSTNEINTLMNNYK
jgi:hypothetical protein